MGNKLSVRRVMVQTLDEFGNPEGEPTYGVMAADDYAQAYNDTFDTFEDLRKAIVESGNILSLVNDGNFEEYGNIGMANFYGDTHTAQCVGVSDTLDDSSDDEWDDDTEERGIESFSTPSESMTDRIFDAFTADPESEEYKEAAKAMNDFTEMLIRSAEQGNVAARPQDTMKLTEVRVHLQADVRANLRVPATLDAEQQRILARNLALCAFSVTARMDEEISEYGYQETQKAAANVTKQHWHGSKVTEFQSSWNLVDDVRLPTKDPKFMLSVETDFDFGIRFRDWDYTSNEFTIVISDVSELDEMEILGPFGAPAGDDVKSQEFLTAIEAIKKNPHERFSNLGGNRGVEWTPIPEV